MDPNYPQSPALASRIKSYPSSVPLHGGSWRKRHTCESGVSVSSLPSPSSDAPPAPSLGEATTVCRTWDLGVGGRQCVAADIPPNYTRHPWPLSHHMPPLPTPVLGLQPGLSEVTMGCWVSLPRDRLHKVQSEDGDRSLKELRFQFLGTQLFPPEETGVTSPKASMCSVRDTVSPFAQCCLINLLLTLSLCTMVFC